MRIISGKSKGKKLNIPTNKQTRPLKDMVRESIFNLLAAGRFGNRLENCRVLDLFAGTGALGLEALSRGANSAVFVDNGAHALQLLRKNIAICGAKNITQVIKTDATKTLPQISENNFDTVFIDPPYGKGLGQKAMKNLRECEMLRKDTLIILEEGCEINAVEGFSVKDCRRYGSSYAHFLTQNIF